MKISSGIPSAVLEMEGFEIDKVLEDEGRRLITGKLSLEDFLADCRREARRCIKVSFLYAP